MIIALPVDTAITSVTVTSTEITLPNENDADDRPTVDIGTVINLVVDILPSDATNQNYTVTTTNSRAEADGNKVTFVYGNTGPGSVSIKITFEDTSVGNNGVLEYRFETIENTVPQDTPITDVTITSPEITLPEANNSDIRDDIDQNTVINLVVDILPIDASNKNYTVSVSNSRGTVDGNEVTFTTPGLISIIITFEDTSVGVNGVFNFRFTIK